MRRLWRSKRLEMEFFHPMEAMETTLESQGEPLQRAAAEWMKRHPDWRVARVDELASPTVSMVTQTVIVGSAD